MTTGEKIRYLRKQLGITQEELARRAELHPVSIRKYEIGKMVPQVSNARKLATVLGVSASALLEYDPVDCKNKRDWLTRFVLMLDDAKVFLSEADRKDLYQDLHNLIGHQLKE